VSRRKNRIGGQFAPRLIEMLESPAYRALSLSGHRILARTEIEMAHHGGGDNGKLPVTFDDFEAYGIHRHAIAPGIRECEALGFLEVTQRGCAGNREFRHASLYRLTYRPLNRADPTDEWRRIRNIEEAMRIARQARKPVQQQARSQKWKSSGGKRQVSVAETTTENANPLVAESTITHPMRKPPLLSISRGRRLSSSPGIMGRDGPGLDGRHTRKSLMAYVANVVEEQLHDLDPRRVAARRRAKGAIMEARQ
jgi:hypothetical protein